MSGEFDPEGQWPELFEGLMDRQCRAIVNALASGWHEGWEPNRPDVEDLTLYVRGDISQAEYDRRSMARAAVLPADDEAGPEAGA